MSEPLNEKCVLIIEDDEVLSELMVELFAVMNVVAIRAADAATALSIFRQRAADIGLVMLDWHLEGETSEPIYHQLRREARELPIVVVSGMAHRRLAPQLTQDPPDAFLGKPFDYEHLYQLAQKFLFEPSQILILPSSA